MDLIKTIEDEAQVEYLSEDDSTGEGDEVPVQKKSKMSKKKKDGKATPGKDFVNDFSFVNDEKEYLKDPWVEISALMRKRTHKGTTIEEKIKKIRTGKNFQPDLEVDHENSDSGVSDDSEDDVRVKSNDLKRKQRKQVKNGGNKSVVSIETCQDDEDVVDDTEEGNNYFEDPEPFDESASFFSMKLSRPLLKSIEALRFIHPTPIQAATIPTALQGRDICGCAATGTGKTAAYMLPVLERLLYRPRGEESTRVLLLVPTRELGVQVFQVTKQLAQFTSIDVALSVGGLDLRLQEVALRKNPDIVIATPGRLIDHIKNTPSFTLESIEVLILDEADRLLDECFLEQIKEVVQSCSPTRQTMLFSATMTDRVNELAAVSLRKPVKIFVDSNKSVAWNLQQEFVRIRPSQEAQQEAILAALLSRTFRDHVIVFIRTKQHCHRLHIILGLLGLKVGELHGNMSQAQRLESLKKFKEEEIDVLLTTDVAARGLDISGVKTVINYQLPDVLEQYIHRVGRTARAGRAGRSVSFATESQRKIVKDIVKNARNSVKGRAVPVQVIAKFNEKISSLADDVKAILEEEAAEKEIAMLENRANRLEKELEQGPNMERVWYEGKRKPQKQADDKPKKTITKKKQKKKSAEENELNNEANFYAREAKRNRKQKRIRTVVDNDAKFQSKKTSKKKNKGNFFM